MGLHTQLRNRLFENAEAAFSRHSKIFTEYFAQLDEHPNSDQLDRTVSVIARSAASPLVHALIDNAEELKSRGIKVHAIISKVEPASAFEALKQALALLGGSNPTTELARWANKACLQDAHEQVILGRSMCWSGDMMRREPGKCDGLDLFERNAPQTVRLGMLAFDAIWEICERLPASGVRGVLASRATASANHPDHRALAARSFMGRLERVTSTRH